MRWLKKLLTEWSIEASIAKLGVFSTIVAGIWQWASGGGPLVVLLLTTTAAVVFLVLSSAVAEFRSRKSGAAPTGRGAQHDYYMMIACVVILSVCVVYVTMYSQSPKEQESAPPAAPSLESIVVKWIQLSGLPAKRPDPRFYSDLLFQYQVNFEGAVYVQIYAGKDDPPGMVMTETELLPSDFCWDYYKADHDMRLKEAERRILSTRTNLRLNTRAQRKRIQLFRKIAVDANESSAWFRLELEELVRAERMMHNLYTAECREP